MKNTRIINCEQCLNSLVVNVVGSHCGIMCPDCGWQPDCSGEEICDNEDQDYKTIRIKESNANS